MIATHYEGEPPDNAISFWEKISSITDAGVLSGMSYVLFALGDLTYKHYCGFGKSVNKKLLELGAKMIQDEIGTGSNDQNKIEIAFNEWKTGIWRDVLESAPENLEYIGESADPTPVAPGPVIKPTKFVVSVNSASTPEDVDTLRGKSGFEVVTSVRCKLLRTISSLSMPRFSLSESFVRSLTSTTALFTLTSRFQNQRYTRLPAT